MRSVTIPVSTGEGMRALGARLAKLLRAGDLLVLSGGLGAGKTTLTQGIGTGLGVRGAVTSPTFVIARVHPSEVGGPPLVHVDAYRLGGGADVAAEVDDLDLDASLDESVTVVEWGEGVVEELTDDRLEVAIERDVPAPEAPEAPGDSALPADSGDTGDAGQDAAGGRAEPRLVRVRGIGTRWHDVDLDALTG